MLTGHRVHQAEARVHRPATHTHRHLRSHGSSPTSHHLRRGNGKQTEHFDGKLLTSEYLHKSFPLQWLNEEQLIQKVVSLLAPPAVVDGGGGSMKEGEEAEGSAGEPLEESPAEASEESPTLAVFYPPSEAHDNAGQLLVEIIRVSR